MIPVIFMILIEVHLKCLGNKLCNVHRKKGDGEIFEELRKCILYHNHLMRLIFNSLNRLKNYFNQ